MVENVRGAKSTFYETRAFSYRKHGRKKPSFPLIEQSKFVVLLIRGLKFLREGLSLITRPGLCPGFFCFRPSCSLSVESPSRYSINVFTFRAEKFVQRKPMDLKNLGQRFERDIGFTILHPPVLNLRQIELTCKCANRRIPFLNAQFR